MVNGGGCKALKSKKNHIVVNFLTARPQHYNISVVHFLILNVTIIAQLPSLERADPTFKFACRCFQTPKVVPDTIVPLHTKKLDLK